MQKKRIETFLKKEQRHEGRTGRRDVHGEWSFEPGFKGGLKSSGELTECCLSMFSLHSVMIPTKKRSVLRSLTGCSTDGV